MPTRIPFDFDRHNTTKIPAAEGWVYAKPMQGGERYYVTATRHRAETVERREVYGYVRELVNALGGPVPYMPGPLPRDYESKPGVIVKRLLDHS